jgi:hypothetical protein
MSYLCRIGIKCQNHLTPKTGRTTIVDPCRSGENEFRHRRQIVILLDVGKASVRCAAFGKKVGIRQCKTGRKLCDKLLFRSADTIRIVEQFAGVVVVDDAIVGILGTVADPECPGSQYAGVQSAELKPIPEKSPDTSGETDSSDSDEASSRAAQAGAEN